MHNICAASRRVRSGVGTMAIVCPCRVLCASIHPAVLIEVGLYRVIAPITRCFKAIDHRWAIRHGDTLFHVASSLVAQSVDLSL